ncbi:unnamed protein product [Adineta ricciae]|uniref:AAA+ ATPase domain-containing protein n=1 Tax=Adineta ricciae TaxID=249248 RepID=A0A814CRG3_ADIRI|nr:unnamed protein product [Adineta ricciae]CAF1158088.1 unnamed protein product [Adineta ricciae]
MTDHSWVSAFDYLQSKTGFNEENFHKIHHWYTEKCGGDFDSVEDEQEVLQKMANQLKIKLDDDDDQGMALLRQCVVSDDESQCRTLVEHKLSQMKPITPRKSDPTTSVKPIASGFSSSTIRGMITTLTEIDCVLTIKKAFSEVSGFIQSFLLKPINRTNQPSTILNSDQEVLLDNQSILYHFIGQQVSERHTNASASPSDLTNFRLVEPIKVKDAFDEWTYDHLRGLFDLDLKPHTSNTTFPTRWCLSDNVSIYCRIQQIDSTGSTPSSLKNSDRSTSIPVDKFLRHSRSQDNSGRSSTRRAPFLDRSISEYPNSVNGSRKQDGQGTDDERDDLFSLMKEKSVPSVAELYADLHLVKLYFRYMLREHPAVKEIEDLAKIDIKCLSFAFEEIESEIFNDDKLFERMKEFFLPLTISEEELRRHWSSNGNIQCVWEEKRQNLHRKGKELERKLVEAQQIEQELSSKTDEIEEQIDETAKKSLAIKERQDSLEDSYKQKNMVTRFLQKKLKQGKRTEKEIEAVCEEYQRCKQIKDKLMSQLSKCKEKEKKASEKVEDLENQIEETKVALNRINTKLDKKPGPVDTQLVKPPRGLILYGPPGTGKSDILKRLAQKLGITLVSQPLAAGELNRPLVGQSEEILIALCSRCSHIPYAMCALAIDEIDSLAPKRGENSSEGKVDKISVLLSLIEGIKDVPNLMIFSATNRLHMMDEAFLRRLSGKFFVGRPSSQSRTSMLGRIPFWALDPELLDQLSIATTNFSGAAVKALGRAITTKCIKMNNAKPISEMDALTLADQIAQYHQIYIGSETLPRLLKRNQQDTSRRPIHSLSTDEKYTGRMIVDLHEQYVRMEVFEPKAKENECVLSVIERKLYPNETNVQTLLERLTAYGKSQNVQLLQLIDLNLLASQSAYDQTKIYETLKDRYDEYVSYTRSMIIYDMDALVGVNKSENDSNMGSSTSYTISNQGIYAYVLARFRDRVMEDNQGEKGDSIQRWAVAIIREPYLLRQFVADVQFPRSQREEEELETERRLAEKLLKCVKCQDFYIERENRMGSCNFHDGFLYDISTDELRRCTPSEALKELNVLECDAFQKRDSSDTYERQKNKFKWICCNETFSGVCKGGCKRGKHGFFWNEYQPSVHGVSTKKINPPQQVTIEQWENACVTNEEYEEKWQELRRDD